ncbi:MAG: NADH-quinone oxidoreductase subunit K [Oscillospiraceae bacterium]|nr:NADH-quinone oxidoreductase subunit K [Oscillospiraceae bacterium]MDD4368180.1 NADH-quinone oxidoreductase subunit K [Oscillospiraceae bacterium]
MNLVIVLLIIGLLMIVAGCWCLMRTFHLLKMTIGIEVAMKAVTLFLVLAGRISGKIALSETFVITVMVAEVIVAVVGTGTAVGLFRKYGSMDVRNLKQLKG